MAYRIARHSRPFTRQALLAGTLLTACTRWQVQDVPPRQLVTAQRPSSIRVTRSDSSKVILADPAIVGDTLYGTEANHRKGIPMDDVSRLSVRRKDPVATGVLIAVPAAVLVGAALIIRLEIANTD